MKAIKDNKVYTIDSGSKAEYLARGFNIYDDGGKMIARSPSATVPAAQYDELLAKYNALVAEKSAEKGEEKAAAEQPVEQPKKKGKSGGEPDVSGTE
jgi:hypothetical protein